MKKLTLSSTDKKISGVLGGFAHYIDQDVTLIRLVYVLFGLLTGPIAIVFYVIAAWVIPADTATVSTSEVAPSSDTTTTPEE